MHFIVHRNCPVFVLPLTLVLSLALSSTALADGLEEASSPPSFLQIVDSVFTSVVDHMATVLFCDFDTGVPFIVMWLLTGAVFFTLRMGFINFRGFFHAVRVTRGDYDDP